jgi:hypothetical protein
MHIAEKEHPSLPIDEEKFLAFVREMISGHTGRDDEDHPLPPGPWDPVIRLALERTLIFDLTPAPWKVLFTNLLAKHPEGYDAIGDHRFGEEVALNPQPLPPRYALLVSVAQTVISRAELLQEIADSISREGTQQGIIVGGYISRFIDDWCGNGFTLRWPFPGPRPNWFPREVHGIDLVVIATRFDQAAKGTFTLGLRRHLADASARFVEAGLSKMR